MTLSMFISLSTHLMRGHGYFLQGNKPSTYPELHDQIVQDVVNPWIYDVA